LDINEFFPSTYLKAADILGKKLECTIDRIESGDEGVQNKPIMYLTGKDKGIVCNRTNAMNVASVYGNDTSAWTGKKVIISTHKVTNPSGALVDGIKVEAVQEVQTFEEGDVPF